MAEVVDHAVAAVPIQEADLQRRGPVLEVHGDHTPQGNPSLLLVLPGGKDHPLQDAPDHAPAPAHRPGSLSFVVLFFVSLITLNRKKVVILMICNLLVCTLVITCILYSMP